VSLPEVIGHRLRKAQLGAASGPFVAGLISSVSMNHGAKVGTGRYNS